MIEVQILRPKRKGGEKESELTIDILLYRIVSGNDLAVDR